MSTDPTARVFRPEDGYSYDYNPYYNPENCGLEMLAEIETAGSYEFCTTILLRDKATGGAYIAQDSGCSCPTPFENFTSLADFTQPQTEGELVRLLDEHHYNKPSPSEVMDFIRKWREVAA